MAWLLGENYSENQRMPEWVKAKTDKLGKKARGYKPGAVVFLCPFSFFCLHAPMSM